MKPLPFALPGNEAYPAAGMLASGAAVRRRA